MARIADILRRKSLPAAIGLTAVALVGLGLLIAGALSYRHYSLQQHRMAEINQHLARISSTAAGHDETARQLQALAELAARFDRPLPQAGYSALWHRWKAAMEQFERVSDALHNRYLAGDAAGMLPAFHDRLLKLRDACTSELEQRREPSPSLRWKLRNLRGSVAVLLAYSVLNHEQDGRKAAKFLSDALDDYKAAIAGVDDSSTSSFERSLPRWNMELIVGLGEYRKIGLSEIRRENMTQVQEQLEAFIPEVAGFAPGVPLETRVEK
jgi:hypothetical protein